MKHFCGEVRGQGAVGGGVQMDTDEEEDRRTAGEAEEEEEEKGTWQRKLSEKLFVPLKKKTTKLFEDDCKLVKVNEIKD